MNKVCLSITLLYLLAIYAKRVNSITKQECNNIWLQNQESTLVFAPKFVQERELDFTIFCDIIKAIEPLNQKLKDKHVRESIARKAKVCAWYKDGEPLHRINGNLFRVKDRGTLLTLNAVGTSDGGQYTCVIDYSNLDPQHLKEFKLHSSISFPLQIYASRDILPDVAPSITHAPTNLYPAKGSNVLIECKHTSVLLTVTRIWFKSCPMKDSQCIQQFERKYREFQEGLSVSTDSPGSLNHLMQDYIIQGEHDDVLKVDNVTDHDSRYYGCIVWNSRGLDSRLGSINFQIDQSYSTEVPESSLMAPNSYKGTNIVIIVLVLVVIFLAIAGHLLQANGHLMTRSVCPRILDDEKNPSISSNSNSDEASCWDKSVSAHGDNCRTLYLHTSNTTTTTVPLYDHPPSAGKARLFGTLVQDACVINPFYGYIRSKNDATDWLFPRRNLERLDKIGEGQFGEVWRYIARQKDGSESFVAVKQLKNRAGLGDRERLELISEIEIMKLINDHPNVIKLLNYCADDYEPLLLIMEYAENGKLQTYLRDCRSFRSPYGCIGIESRTHVTSKELIKFSYHIAKGMEYIASKGIIHRDLASRNVLVSKDKVCKVADFGFARRVTDECAYERTSASPVPVKWMAPEALVENKFTSKSDVFSLGILMWEIVTLGATPYEYLTSSEVYRKVTSGGRLDKPNHCKGEFYKIMSSCWLHNPADRPTFKEVSSQLEKLLLSDNDYIELDQYPEHAYYNILNVAEKEVVHII